MTGRPFNHGTLPEGWTATKLRSFLFRRRDTGHPHLTLLSVNLPEGVVPRRTGDGRPAPSLDLSGYQRVRKNDLVMNQLGKPHGALGVSRYEGIISPAYFVAEIGPLAVPRYIHHLLRTQLYISEYERRGKHMPPSQFDISWGEFRNIDVTLPPLEEQRAIADFLDIETARIDALIDKKRRLITLLDERLSVHTAEVLHSSEADGISGTGPWPWVRLRHVASVHGGLTLGKTYSDGEPYPYLRVANVQDRRLDLADIATIDLPPSIARNFVLEPGDLLMLEGNGNPENLGRGTLWYGEIEPCLHQNHVHVVRADRSKVSPEYLDWMVRTPWARWVFAGSGQQVGIATLSQQKILDLPIPLAPRGEQARLVAALEASLAAHNDVKAKLTDQIALLEEKRRALITAAVTGEFAVPGSAAT